MRGLAGRIGLFQGGQVGGGCGVAEHHARIAQMVFMEVLIGEAHHTIIMTITLGQYLAFVIALEVINHTSSGL